MLLSGRTVHISGDDGTLAAGLTARGAELVGADGPVDLVVHVVTGDLTERPLAAMTPEEWVARCDVPLTEAIDAAQAAHARRPTRLVFVVPSLGLTGAAGLAPLATVAEGVRSLAKTAARQWGADGMTVSTVARHVAGPIVALESLTEPPTDDDVAEAVAVLASASAVTGATLVVDQGTVLVP